MASSSYTLSVPNENIFDNLYSKYGKIIDISEYINERNYDLDNYAYIKFWKNIDNRLPLLIDDDLIEWIGYDFNDAKRMRQNFIELLDTNNILYDSYKYNELIEYIEENPNNSIAIPEKVKNIQKRKFIIMTVRNFKRALMMCNTARGKIARDYYIFLEEIYYEYNDFQKYCKNKEISDLKNILGRMEIQNEKLIQQNTVHNIKIDELLKNLEEAKEERQELKEEVVDIGKDVRTLVRKKAVEPENTKLWHKLIIVDVSNIVEGIHKDFDYYSIRAQAITADPKYEKCENGEKVYESGDFEANPINLYNKIKKYFRNKAEFRNNHIKLKENINREDFLRKLINYCEVIKNDIDR